MTPPTWSTYCRWGAWPRAWVVSPETRELRELVHYRPSWWRCAPVLVEVPHPRHQPDGQPAGRVWTVTRRRGAQAAVIADNDLGWSSAHALVRQLEDLLDPVSDRGGAVVPWPRL